MSDSKTIVFSPETAARIAQRVNALDGLSDDALDGGWNFKDYERFVVNLEKKRKELLEALEQIAAYPKTSADELSASSMRDIARSAIAKAKGVRMSEIKNKPAFPHNTVYPDNAFEEHSGLSMRDYFAAKAMQSFVTQEGWQFKHLAESAYQLADAMLAERERGE